MHTDSEIRQSACELDLVVALPAVLAGKGADQNLSEEGDGGQEDGGVGWLVAGGTLCFCDGG